MYNSLPYKTKQFLFLLVKLSIIVGAFYFIYNKVVHNEHISFSHFLIQLEKSVASSAKTVSILLSLTTLNWFFEILKWKVLVSSIKKISITDAAKQSLGSLTASLFTPNRIGEYGAKAVYYKKGYRRKIMLLNLIGNVSQMTITTVFGIIGLIYFFSNHQVDLEFFRLRRIVYVVAFIIVFIIFGTRYGGRRIRGFYIDKIINFVKQIPLSIHLKSLLLSIVRYLIFSFQFYFLLRVFNIEINYLNAITLISSIYLIASIIPSMTFFDWLIKGSVAIWVFSFYPVNELIIVTITLLMWALNFALPAIFGSYFVLNFNFSSVFENQKTIE